MFTNRSIPKVHLLKTLILVSMLWAPAAYSAEDNPENASVVNDTRNEMGQRTPRLGVQFGNASEQFNTLNGGISVELPIFRVEGDIFHARYVSGDNSRQRMHGGLGPGWNRQWFGRLDIAEIKSQTLPYNTPEDMLALNTGLRFAMWQIGADGSRSRMAETSTTGTFNRFGIFHNTEYRFTNQSVLDMKPVLESSGAQSYGGYVLDFSNLGLGSTINEIRDRDQFTVVQADGSRIDYTHTVGALWSSKDDYDLRYKVVEESNLRSFYPTKIVHLDGRGTQIDYHANTPLPKVVTQCQWVSDFCIAESKVFFDIVAGAANSPDSTYINKICYPGANTQSSVNRSSDWQCTELGHLNHLHQISSSRRMNTLNEVIFEGDRYQLEFNTSATFGGIGYLDKLTLPRGALVDYDWWVTNFDRGAKATSLKQKTVVSPGQSAQVWRFKSRRTFIEESETGVGSTSATNHVSETKTMHWDTTIVDEPIGDGQRKSTVYFHYPMHKHYRYPLETRFNDQVIVGSRNPLAGKLGRVWVYDRSIIDETPNPFVRNRAASIQPIVEYDYGYTLSPFGRSGINTRKAGASFVEYLSRPAYSAEILIKNGTHRGTVTIFRDQQNADRFLSHYPVRDYDVYGLSNYQAVYGVNRPVKAWHHQGCESLTCRVSFNTRGEAVYEGCDDSFRQSQFEPSAYCANDAIEFDKSAGPMQAMEKTMQRGAAYLSKNIVSLVSSETVSGSPRAGAPIETIGQTKYHYDNAIYPFPVATRGDQTNAVLGRLTATEQVDLLNPQGLSRVSYTSFFVGVGAEPSGAVAAEATRVEANRYTAKQYSFQTVLGGIYQRKNPTVTRVLTDNGSFTDITQVSYNAWGLPLEKVDENSQRARVRYDHKGRITARFAPGISQPVATFSYADSGNGSVITETFSGQYPEVTKTTYDSLGRITGTSKETDAGSIETHSKYLGITDKVTHSTASGITSSVTYDVFARPVSTTRHGQDGLETVAQQIYGDVASEIQAGERVEIDVMGRRETLKFNLLGQLESKRLADGNQLTFEYDGAGRLLRTIHPDRKISEQRFNSFGDLDQLTKPESGTSSTDYYLNGAVKWVEHANGHNVHYQYDARGRKVEERYGDGELIRFEFDTAVRNAAIRQTNLAGRLSRVVHDGGSESYSYDSQGNVTAQSVALTGLPTKIAEMRYDSLSRVTYLGYQLGFGDAVAMEYHYGRGGELRRVVDKVSGQNVAVWQYDEYGRVQKKVLGSNLQQIDFFYDGLGRITDINDVNDNGSLSNDIFAARYGYSRSSTVYNAATRMDEAPSYVLFNSVGNPLAGYRLSYDVLNRLTSAEFLQQSACQWGTRCLNRGMPRIAANTLQINGYDAVGSILGITRYNSTGIARSTEHQYYDQDSSRRLSGLSGSTNASFSYDAAGNLTRDSRWGRGAFLAYSDRNRLVHIGDGRTDQRFTYDHMNRRVLERSRSNLTVAQPGLPNGQASKTIAKHTVYIGNQKVAAYQDQQVKTLFMGKTAIRRIADSYVGSTYFVHDLIGTPRAAIHQSGEVLEVSDYDPFGAKLTQRSRLTDRTAGQLTPQAFAGFEQHQKEQSTPFFYATNRFYDPGTARFMRPDPLADLEPTMSSYVYAQNNPYAIVDPKGLRNSSSLTGSFRGGHVQVVQFSPSSSVSGSMESPVNLVETSVGGCPPDCTFGELLALYGYGAAEREKITQNPITLHLTYEELSTPTLGLSYTDEQGNQHTIQLPGFARESTTISIGKYPGASFSGGVANGPAGGNYTITGIQTFASDAQNKNSLTVMFDVVPARARNPVDGLSIGITLDFETTRQINDGISAWITANLRGMLDAMMTTENGAFFNGKRVSGHRN